MEIFRFNGEPKHGSILVQFLLSRGQWFYLFSSLILLLIFYPYFELKGSGIIHTLLNISNSALILTVVYTASYKRRQFVISLIFAFPALVFFWLPDIIVSPWVILCSTGLLYFHTIILIIPKLFSSKEVGTNEIFGTTSLYLLIGFLWASLFHALEMIQPGSFYWSVTPNSGHIFHWSEFIFFSFTTLTTLGYGDITPITINARSMAITEAITGVIFIASILSRVVGLYVAQTLEEKRKK